MAKTFDEIGKKFVKADEPRKCACTSLEICNEARLAALGWFKAEQPFVTAEMMVAYKVGYAARAMKGA